MARKRISALIILVLSLILLFTASPSNAKAIECACDVMCRVEVTYRNSSGEDTTKQFIQQIAITPSMDDNCNGFDVFQAQVLCCKYARSRTGTRKSCFAESWACVEVDYCLSSSELGPDAPEILTLRDFRDEVLVQTETGQRLKDLYYRYSPAMIKLLDGNDSLKAHALGRIREVSRLIDEHLYGSGLGDDDYDRVRIVIEESIHMIRNLQSRYAQAEPDEALLDDEVTNFLTDETLFEISGLIDQLLEELGQTTRFSPAQQ